MTVIDSPSPFLSGLLAPVTDERDDRDLAVSGDLPPGLRGMFVRNGPNPYFAPPGRYHPFDGDGMVHALYLGDGPIRYRNRWVRSLGLEAERRRGQACYGGLAEYQPPPTDVAAEAGAIKNVANTHFVHHAGRYLALLEVAPPTEMTRELDTVGEHDFDGRLVGGMTAHPKLDPLTGEMLFFGYSAAPPYLRYHVVDAKGSLVHSVDLDLPVPVMMHDFVVTEHYAVFIAPPAVFDIEALLGGGPALRWDAARPTLIGVLPRRGAASDVRWFEVDPFYVVHYFNAFEDGGDIQFFGPRMPSMPGGFEFQTPQATPDPTLWSWRIDLAAGTITDEQLADAAGEFSRIDDRRAGRRHRYGYCVRQRDPALDFSFHALTKHDLDTGELRAFTYADDETCGEHVFAPDPSGTGEDDGWLLSLVTNETTSSTDLVVLDARDVEAGPVARVHIPRQVPLGFHANWLPEG
jgi:carotenoid cleavage dioxygenase